MSGSLSCYLFYDLSTHSDLQLLQILFAAYFSCSVCSVSGPVSCFWVTGNEQALAEHLLLQVEKKVTSSNSSKAVQCLLSLLCFV